MVTNDYIVMLKYYCMLIYTMTMDNLGILPWILGCHEDKFIVSSIFTTSDRLQYAAVSSKLTHNTRVHTHSFHDCCQK
jgi:hypothetical protein